MPDVGVLNLNIHSDSTEAEQSLNRLAGALSRIKEAVNGAKLSPVASGIRKIADAVNNGISEETISKLGRLSDELSKLKGLGNLNIKITGANSVRDVADTIEEARMSMGAINTGFEQIGQGANNARGDLEGFNNTIRDTMELMQNTAWTGGVAQFRELFEQMDNMRMRMSLPAGEQTWLSDQVEQGWEAWKNGAIEVEGTVTDAMNTVTARLGEPIQYLTGMSSQLGSMNDYLEHSNTLMEDLARNTSAVSGGENAIIPYTGGTSTLEESIQGIRHTTEQTTQSLNNMKETAYEAIDGYDAAIEFARRWNASTGRGLGFSGEKDAIDYVNQLVNGASQLDLVNMKIEALTDRLYEGVNSGKMAGDQIADTVMKIKKLQDQLEELEKTTTGISGAWNSFKAGIKGLFPATTQLLGRFKQIAKYRMLRAVLRSITSGFSEGVQNVYQYSKAVGTSLAPAMDQAATALQQMKNSIGAAVSPLIQSLVPVLQTVVNWFIEGVNWANQFFALLRGQSTWTRALPESAEAFEKNAKSAKSASKAMKDLLADWDELNIIQSESGGGSGSGSGKTAEEYKNMFEEVSEFSDSVKGALGFIDDYLGGLPGLLGKAGAILLGWKFSKAFSGLLGTLGKFVAGGALIDLGLNLSYGAGFDAGAKGFFDAKDIVRAIVGSLATAIGGSLITSALGLGGVWGFGIGLGVAAVMTIIGYCQGEKDLNDKRKWGNLTKTQEEIEKFVREQFTFDVIAEIDVMNAQIKDETDAKKKVDEAVKKFNESFDNAQKVVADIDTSTAEQKVAAVKQAAEDAQASIKALQSLIETNEKGLEWTLTNFTFRNENGEDITQDLLANLKGADKTLSEYFTGFGEKLANLIYEGEKSGWKNGEMDAALELMASQKRILDRADEMQDKLKFEQQTMAEIKNVDSRETALATYEEQKKRLDEYRETIREKVKTETDNLLYLASLAESAAVEAGYDSATNTGSEQAMQLHQTYLDFISSYNEIMDDFDGAVEERLKETKENMAKAWAETLQKVYGDDYERIAKDLGKGGVFEISWEEILKDPFGDSYSLNPENINKHGIEETANALKELLIKGLINPTEDYNGLISYYVNELSGDIWDLMTDDARKNIASRLLESTDLSSNAYKIFKQMFNLDDETASKYIQMPEYQDIWKDAFEQNGEAVNPDITVEPNLEINEKDLFEQLKTEVEAALEDGQLDIMEQFDLMTKYTNLGLGVNALDDALKELQYNLDEEGWSLGSLRPAAIVAANAMSPDYGKLSGRGYDSTPTFNAEPMEVKATVDDQNFSDDVEAGTRRANADQNELIQQLISLATRIANKEFVVHLNPDSTWADHNARSAAAMGRITG